MTAINTNYTLHNKHGQALILNDHVVLIHINDGIEMNGERSRHSMQRLADSMPGDFGVIVERNTDYSTMPVEVFQTLNEIVSLKAIAIVAQNDIRLATTNIERRLYRNPLAVFAEVNSALAWIEKTLTEPKTRVPVNPSP